MVFREQLSFEGKKRWEGNRGRGFEYDLAIVLSPTLAQHNSNSVTKV
jgi:hypothetical protein